MLRVTRQEAIEDHLGAGLIHHGDSVIIRMKSGKQLLSKKGGTARISSLCYRR